VFANTVNTYYYLIHNGACLPAGRLCPKSRVALPAELLFYTAKRVTRKAAPDRFFNGSSVDLQGVNLNSLRSDTN
jgi:hypothetical protein